MPPVIGVSKTPDTSATDDPLAFAVSSLSDYVVIYSGDGVSLTLLKEIRSLQTALEERFGVKPASKSDTAEPTAHEIIVGNANRAECATAFASTPRIKDYSVQIVGEKLVLTGWSEETLTLAIRAAVEKILALSSDSKIFFEASMQLIHTGSYDLNSFVLGERNIQSYTIVYQEEDHCQALAERLCNTVREKS